MMHNMHHRLDVCRKQLADLQSEFQENKTYICDNQKSDKIDVQIEVSRRKDMDMEEQLLFKIYMKKKEIREYEETIVVMMSAMVCSE